MKRRVRRTLGRETTSGLSTFVATLFVAFAAFAFWGVALGLSALCGRKTKRRCACSAAREAVRLVEERERAAFDAKRYRPETVDVASLPLVSPELAETLTRVPGISGAFGVSAPADSPESSELSGRRAASPTSEKPN